MTRRSWRYLTAAGGVIVVLAVTGLIWYRLELRPAASSGKTQQFTITAGETAPVVGKRLQSTGLIRSKDAFVTYLGIHGMRGQLKVGTFDLSPTDSTQLIAATLTNSALSIRRLVIPEGDNLSQIQTLAAQVGIKPADFKAALAAPHHQAILAAKPAGVDLEGYLFPDTYEVGPSTTAAELVDTMITTTGTRLTPDIIQAWSAEGLSINQGLTLASIVEKEVSTPAEQPIVAQIFLKRLATGMALGSDVTAKYASDLAGVPFSTTIDSPYNTRINVGLPPGPICSPGLAAMKAVANPAKTDYLYFLSGDDGKMHYSTTYAQHQANIAKYLH